MSKSNRSTNVIVNAEIVPIKLLEVNQRVENTASNYPKYQFVPSGKLRFEIIRTKDFHEYSVYTEDSSSAKLEDKILNIVAKIEYEAIYIKEEDARQQRLRLEREEAHRKWELEEQRRKELKKRQKEEMERYDDKFVFTNPGLLRLPVEQIYAGEETRARNQRIQNMFHMIGFSGFPLILSAWNGIFWGIHVAISHFSYYKGETKKSHIV